MGMYDTINGEQIKVFYSAYVHIGDGILDNNNVIGYSGGSLNYYGIGDNVPYVKYYYNLGKDFNIIDLQPYENEEPMIHLIRNGKNVGSKLLTEITDEDLKCNNYDDHGNRFNFNNVNDILNFQKITDEIRNIRQNASNVAWHEYMNYLRTHRENTIDEKELERLNYEMKLEKLETEKKLNPFYIERSKYVLEDPLDNEYSNFGAIVSGLRSKIFENALKKDANFIISDDRLTFIVAYNKLKLYLDKGDQFLKDYFNFMQLPSSMAEELINDLIELERMYIDMCNLKINIEQIGENYLLNDILNGRYKEHYLKYDILPFEGFDYDTWKYCKQDYEKKGDSMFDRIEKRVDEKLKKEFQKDEER